MRTELGSQIESSLPTFVTDLGTELILININLVSPRTMP